MEQQALTALKEDKPGASSVLVPIDLSNQEILPKDYHCVPLGAMPKDDAVKLCQQLFDPKERFAQGFYRYWKNVDKMSEADAWKATYEELDQYLSHILNNLDDPHMHSVGFNHNGQYIPAGIYGFRALRDHPIGPKIQQILESNNLQSHYSGNLAIAHTYSSLHAYRNLSLLKYTFALIALEALEKEFKHIFFFMSDYRLGTIYKRFGLEFPDYLKFQDSKHLVGTYDPFANYEEVMAAAQFYEIDLSGYTFLHR